MRKLAPQEAELTLLQIKIYFPSFNLTEDVANLWIKQLVQTDAEMVEQNLEDYARGNKFPPVVNDLVKDNDKVLERREKERTRLLIEERKNLALLTTPPPWEREGISHREWLHKQLAKHKAAREAAERDTL